MMLAEERRRLAGALASSRREAGEELARFLELEYGCERCHTRPATTFFDRLFVCGPCRRIIERKLVKHG